MSISTALATVEHEDGIRPLPTIPTAQRLALALPTLEELKVLQAYGEMFAKSGLFPQVQSWQAAAAIIQYGSQLGIDAFTALKDIYWIKGKPTCDASLINSLIKRDHGGEALMPVEATTERCTIKFKRREWDHYEELTVTAEMYQHLIADPTRVTWKTNRHDMLWARCVSTIGRRHFSDTIKGLYTREEMRDAVEADWRPVEAATESPGFATPIDPDIPTTPPIVAPPTGNAERVEAMTLLNAAVRQAFGQVEDAKQIRDDLVCDRFGYGQIREASAADLRHVAEGVARWTPADAPKLMATMRMIGGAETETMAIDVAAHIADNGPDDPLILAALNDVLARFEARSGAVDAAIGGVIDASMAP
jgi:hypothetical protein